MTATNPSESEVGSGTTVIRKESLATQLPVHPTEPIGTVECHPCHSNVPLLLGAVYVKVSVPSNKP